MTNTTILAINVCLYAFAFAYFFVKYGWKNLSTVLLGIYLFSAVFSFVYYINPLFYLVYTSSGNIKLEGVLYLFSVNFLLCTALRNFRLPTDGFILTGYPRKLIDIIQYFLFFVFLISILTSFSSMTEIATSDNLSDLHNITSDSGSLGSKAFLINFLLRIFGGCDIVMLLIAVVNLLLFKDRRKINYLSIVVYLLNTTKIMLLYVSRGIMLADGLKIFVLFLVLGVMIPKTLKKKLYPILTVFAVLGVSFFLTISHSRFKEGNASVYNDLAFVRYAGEAQLNFIGIMYGNTTGDAMGYRMLPLYRRALGLHYAGENKNVNNSVTADYMDQFNPKGPNYVFYQLVGSHYIEWGSTLTFLFALIINLKTNSHFKRVLRTKKLSFMSILFGCFLFSYIAYGIFYALYGNESGNFLFLYMVVFSFLFARMGKEYWIDNAEYIPESKSD